MRKFSASVTLMFREWPALGRLAAARQAGFERVEIQVLEAAPADVATAAAGAGVSVLLLNVGMGDFLQGGSGLSGVPGREQAFLSELDKALAAAPSHANARILEGKLYLRMGRDDVALICLGEKNAPDLSKLVDALNRAGVRFMGGVFPGILHGREAHYEGAILFSAPAIQAPYVIKNLNHEPVNLPEFGPEITTH